ncbi:N-acetyltransferase [Thiorhodococcus mannitoliphagus]|uniref:N-acetyltransferase n=1 Tax=Thiorhodococcus mannitoliphagus TaxID=329406 RepID=A0A6P1DYM1_9GAMM|nr:GNAT family N-acetyltransferase [Thiorhodococcus mannitoliphagus]NEX20665.1 N-acetyltransferase [Thiorhodococcus mannitoliphagus]
MYKLTTHSTIAEIPAPTWNALADPDTPFMRHEFLHAMEEHGCVGERLGWIPTHLALRDDNDRVVAAAPCYIKLNSYGEFVFDWSWADAYERSGRRYYPKLVIASPYTPATGPRILRGRAQQPDALARALAQGAVQVAERLGVSSLHWLFTTDEETTQLEKTGLMRRVGCQFHWQTRGYATFDDFLSSLSAAKRKMIKRERRRVAESGLRIRRVRGDAVTEAEWAIFHQLYCDTFDKRGGLPTLTLPFFLQIAESMGEQLLLVLAYDGPAVVAAAFNLLGPRSLYGRHWGCFRDYHSLHFEACYYQGLDHCIEKGLERFEPGAQGEHKISRGFLPTRTWSAHWIAEPDFRSAVSRFLLAETQSMDDYIVEMDRRSPYRSDTAMDPT